MPVPLRPMTLGDVVDGSFAVLKARPRPILTIVAVFVVPVQIAVGFLQRDALGGAALGDVFSDPTLGGSAGGDAGSAAAGFLNILGPSVTLPLAAAAIAHVVSGWYVGTDVGAGAALRRMASRIPALVVAWIAVHVLEVIAGVFLVVPALAVMGLYVVTAPAIALEGLGPFGGMGRSQRLVGPRFMPTVGLALAVGLISYVINQTVPLLPSALGLFVGLDAGWVLLAAGGTAAGLITMSFVAASSVLMYLDLRVRSEGLDLEIDARERLDG